MIRVVPLIQALALFGCGGSSAEEQANFDWEWRMSTAWDAFDEGYGRGSLEGCEAAAEAIVGEDPEILERESHFYCDPRRNPDEGSNVLLVPPDDPEAEGYELGLFEGCWYAYWELAEEYPSAEACPA